MARAILLCCVSVTLISLAFSLCSTDYMSDDEKIHHHLSELRQSLYDLNHRRIHKRSVSPNYDEIIFRSLSSFCSQLSVNDNRNGSISPPTSAPAPDHSYEVYGPRNSLFASSWTGPNVFPYGILAERREDRIFIVFQLIHSGPATVFQLNPFDFKNISVRYPQDNSMGFVESSVRVEFKAAMCQNDIFGQEVSITYAFGIQDNSRYSIFTALDLCTFGRPRNQSNINTNSNSWTQDGGDFTQNVPRPQFELDPVPGDEIIIRHDYQEIRRNLTVHLCVACEMSINVMLWDTKQKKFNTSIVKMTMTHPDGDIGVRLVYPQTENTEGPMLLKASILQETKTESNQGHANTGNSETISVSALVAVEIDIGDRSGGGKINFMYSWRDSDQTRRPLAPFVQTSRSILLRHEDSRKALPRNTVEITTNGPLHCDKTGTRSTPRINGNCSLTCHAHGSDIKDIRIKKIHSFRRPVRAASYILRNSTATAVLDLGLTSRRLEGKYKCIVQTSNGQRVRKEFQLYTSGFTEIEEFSVQEFTSNRTTRIACAAKGENPMDLTFSLSSKNGTVLKLDDSTFPRWRFTYASGKILLIFMVDTDMFREPGVYLTCTANGSRGVDIRETAMEQHIYRYKAHVPAIDKETNSTFAWRYYNGTTFLQCSALSSRPMEMSISQGSRRIDNLTENTRHVSQYGIRKTLSVTSPSGNFPKGSVFECRAVDDRGAFVSFVFRLQS